MAFKGSLLLHSAHGRSVYRVMFSSAHVHSLQQLCAVGLP